MYNLDLYDFGNKLKNIRKSQKISIKDFSKAIKKSIPTIYKYENNTITPDFFTVLKIANFLKVNINEFCDLKNIEINEKMINNPFNSPILYFYYRGYNGNLAQFEFELAEYELKQKVYMRNVATTSKDKMKNLYIGSLESDLTTAYFNFKNNNLYNNRFEKIQIIVNLKTPIDNKYLGIIEATSDKDNTPTIRKCIITKNKLTNNNEYNEIYNRLKITKEELDFIEKNGYWNADISNNHPNAAIYLND